MRINTNMAAMNAWRSLETNQSNLQNSLQRLSSGYRINRASDDAAGLAVSEKLKAQMRGVNMAVRNTQDAVSLIQTAEGGASSIQDMLQRMRELAVQAGSDTLADTDRAQLQEEFSSLQAEIDRTSGTVQFNGTKLINGDSAQAKSASAGVSQLVANGVSATAGTLTLTVTKGGGAVSAVAVAVAGGPTGTVVQDSITNGVATMSGTGDLAGLTFKVDANASTGDTVTLGAGLNFQVGANSGETIQSSLGSLTATNLGIKNLSISSRTNATSAINALDTAVTFVSTQRAKMGAMQNRLDNTISTLQTQSENITSANSRIRDVDMASEMAGFTKFQVLSQASTAMLAQANQLPQGILSLLR